MIEKSLKKKVVVVGGGGHVGLPLSLILAKSKFDVVAFDHSQATVDKINSGQMPFFENEAANLLKEVLESGNFSATSDANSVKYADIIFVVIGTPVDEHLSPDPNALIRVINELEHLINPNQVIILRSTVFPGVSRKVFSTLREKFPNIRVGYCPERIAEGKALVELRELPQIVGVGEDSAFEAISEIFSHIPVECLRTTFEEAELAKLFTNVWRYIKFASANQFFMMSNDFNVDYDRVRHAITYSYPRAADLPSAGFAAGPCLFKDTMQLSALVQQNFPLGNAAMMINEGTPGYIVQRLENKYDLKELKVGILGAAFKPDVDDIRSSLAFKLRKLLDFKCKQVLMCDPLVQDYRVVELNRVLEDSDILILATPHKEFQHLKTSKPIIDIWNFVGKGTLI
jgi:UDP-N-acetyl-D-mannosaminuronic acid dehydrogenase